MASKHNREKRNFDKASVARDTIIKNLKECKSYERLQDIQSKLEKAKSRTQSPFQVTNLTDGHAKTIKAMDLEIEKLIKAKTNEYPKPVIAPVITVDVDPVKTVDETPVVTDKADVVVIPTDSVPVNSTDIIVTTPIVNSTDDKKDESSDDYAPVVTTEPPHIDTVPTCEVVRLYKPLKKDADAFNHAREQELSKVRDNLDILSAKIKALYDKADLYRDSNNTAKSDIYTKAANAAAKIHFNVSALCTDYVYDKINLETFKSKTTDYLKNDTKNVAILKEHRGCKDIIANLLIAVTGVGLLAIAALSVYNGRLSLFKVTSTDSGNKVNDLRDSIAHVASPK